MQRVSSMSKEQKKPQETHNKELSLLLKISATVFVPCFIALIYTSYSSYVVPFSGYGDDDMSYFDEKNPASLSAGDLTHFIWSPNAFAEEAANLSWGLSASFDRGDGVFERPYKPALGRDYKGNALGLGPLFNNNSCESCHISDGRGKPPVGPHEQIEGGFVRVSIPGTGPYGKPLTPPGYGHQIADRAIGDIKPEATVRIEWIEESGTFPDGESYSLRKPNILLTDLAYGPMPDDAVLELRMAPPVFGLGLLEAIPEQTILSWADPDDLDNDGISGRPNYVWDLERGGTVMGRFSWKANSFDIRQQAAEAAINDMGVNSELFLYHHDDQVNNHKSRQNCEPEQTECLNAVDGLDFELSQDQLVDVTAYLQLLGVINRRNMDNPKVQRGEALFHSTGCASCHKSIVTTGEHEISRLENQVIRPYSDLLLHDMGEGLAGRRDFLATQQEWRTAPLWGIGATELVNGHTNFLHDGRARNLEEAVLWHGGEAEKVKNNYMNLTKEDRDLLILFVDQL